MASQLFIVLFPFWKRISFEIFHLEVFLTNKQVEHTHARTPMQTSSGTVTYTHTHTHAHTLTHSHAHTHCPQVFPKMSLHQVCTCWCPVMLRPTLHRFLIPDFFLKRSKNFGQLLRCSYEKWAAVRWLAGSSGRVVASCTPWSGFDSASWFEVVRMIIFVSSPDLAVWLLWSENSRGSGFDSRLSLNHIGSESVVEQTENVN